MENNFYVGDIFHRRFFKFSYIERNVLYAYDEDNYFNLISEKWYTTDSNNKDYVIKDSLIPTDINEYNSNYQYLYEKNKAKIKKFIARKN